MKLNKDLTKKIAGIAGGAVMLAALGAENAAVCPKPPVFDNEKDQQLWLEQVEKLDKNSEGRLEFSNLECGFKDIHFRINDKLQAKIDNREISGDKANKLQKIIDNSEKAVEGKSLKNR